MKKYDSKLRKWVSIEEYERTHKPRDKKVCRGGKPHDYILVLPYYTDYDSTYKHNPQEYYKMMDERKEFIDNQNKEFEAMGIKPKRYWGDGRRESRLYMCSVCKKSEYDVI